MGQTSNVAKQRWNAAHYTQIKISVDHNLATEFKAACAAGNNSMAAILSNYMKKYSRSDDKSNMTKDYSSRRKRRNAVNSIIQQLLLIRDAESDYSDHIPDNLRNSVVYERAESAVDALDEIIEQLEEAY